MTVQACNGVVVNHHPVLEVGEEYHPQQQHSIHVEHPQWRENKVEINNL